MNPFFVIFICSAACIMVYLLSEILEELRSIHGHMHGEEAEQGIALGEQVGRFTTNVHREGGLI